VQAVGQLAEEPPHTYGAHEGEPVLPDATGAQVPALPCRLHASQAPVHAVLQHTPSTHWPLPHWLFAVQAALLVCFGTHAPALQ
jgi:hypothetical protein